MNPIAWFLRSRTGCVVEVHKSKKCIEASIDFENKSQVIQGASECHRYEGPFPLYEMPKSYAEGAVLIDGSVHLVQKGEEMDWVRSRGAKLLYAAMGAEA